VDKCIITAWCRYKAVAFDTVKPFYRTVDIRLCRLLIILKSHSALVPRAGLLCPTAKQTDAGRDRIQYSPVQFLGHSWSNDENKTPCIDVFFIGPVLKDNASSGLRQRCRS
jgi:hypothetical protein